VYLPPTTQTADIVGPQLDFQFVVPGHQRWTLRSVFAVASRAVGGVPDRAYLLTITNGGLIVAQVGAADAGTEPGACSVTFANTPAASVSAGPLGVTVAPFAPPPLDPGYVIDGKILAPAAGDTWISAVAWFDFAYTA
jgi:hypothetical protein